MPVLEWFPDGSYLSFIADSKEKARNSYRLRRGLAKITGLPGFYVRAVDYEITDRGDGEEIITLVTNITDPDEIPAAELARRITSAGRRSSCSMSSRRTSEDPE